MGFSSPDLIECDSNFWFIGFGCDGLGDWFPFNNSGEYRDISYVYECVQKMAENLAPMVTYEMMWEAIQKKNTLTPKGEGEEAHEPTRRILI